jgi:hypothetical protein
MNFKLLLFRTLSYRLELYNLQFGAASPSVSENYIQKTLEIWEQLHVLGFCCGDAVKCS